jgi:hypothetical protein
VRALLQSEKGVRRVNARPVESGVTAFEVELDGKAELRETLPTKVIQKGWALRRLDLRRQKLEDLYMRVVLRAAGTPAVANV